MNRLKRSNLYLVSSIASHEAALRASKYLSLKMARADAKDARQILALEVALNEEINPWAE